MTPVQNRFRSGRMWRVAGYILAIASSLYLVLAIDWARLRSVEFDLQPGVALLVILLYAMFMLLRTVRWKLLLLSNVPVPLSLLFHITCVGSFAAVLVPSGMAEDFTRGIMLNHAVKNVHQTTSSILLERATGLAGYLFFACVGIAMAWPMLGALVPVSLAGFYDWPGLPLGLLTLMLGGGAAWVGMCSRPVRRFVQQTGAEMRRVLKKRASGLAMIGVLAICSPLSAIFANSLVAPAFGVVVPFGLFLFAIPLILLIENLPFSLGVGMLPIRLFLFGFFFGPFGVEVEAAILIGFTTRVLYLLTLAALLTVSYIACRQPITTQSHERS